MKRTSLILLVLLGTLIIPRQAESATITESETVIRFPPGCEGSGSYLQWNRTLVPTIEERLSQTDAAPIEWSTAVPIDLLGGSPAIPGQELVFVLLAADGSVLYQQAYELVQGADGVGRFRLVATLDCSTVPYRAAQLPSASMPAPTPLPLAIVTLIVAAIFASWAAIRLARRPSIPPKSRDDA